MASDDAMIRTVHKRATTVSELVQMLDLGWRMRNTSTVCLGSTKSMLVLEIEASKSSRNDLKRCLYHRNDPSV